MQVTFSLLKKIKFGLTGLLNTVFGYTVYAGLVYSDVSVEISLFLSTVCGVLFNFFTFSKVVFNARFTLISSIKYILVYMILYGINLLLIDAIIAISKLNPYVAQFAALLLIVPISWLLLNYFVFKPTLSNEKN